MLKIPNLVWSWLYHWFDYLQLWKLYWLLANRFPRQGRWLILDLSGFHWLCRGRFRSENQYKVGLFISNKGLTCVGEIDSEFQGKLITSRNRKIRSLGFNFYGLEILSLKAQALVISIKLAENSIRSDRQWNSLDGLKQQRL